MNTEASILLYHGSNQPVQTPRLLASHHSLDFGSGFYLTSSLEQAQRWARRKTERSGNGTPVTTVFEVEQPFPGTLKVLMFHQPDEQWLDFVVANRKFRLTGNDYDIVIGPVANDQTMPTINLYLDGFISKDAAIAELLPQRLKNQFAFRSDASLKVLKFQEVLYG